MEVIFFSASMCYKRWSIAGITSVAMWQASLSELILGLPPANERRRYKVTPSLIGWAQT